MSARPGREGLFDRPFTKAARWLLARGVRPNHFTYLQVPVLIVGAYAALVGSPWLFVSIILVGILLDGGDGILARVGGLQSRAGAALDATFDTLGIAVVLWGASLFHPDAAAWLALLFAANLLLYLQNALLDSKVVSYVRGPILVAVVFPETLLAALLIDTFIVAFELLARTSQTLRARGRRAAA